MSSDDDIASLAHFQDGPKGSSLMMTAKGEQRDLAQVARFLCAMCGYVLGAWPPVGRPAACPGCMAVLDTSRWPEYGCEDLQTAGGGL